MKKSWNWPFGAMAMLIVGCAIWSVGRFADGRMEERTSSRKRNFTVSAAEGLSVRRPGYYGIDFVRCGKCRIENRKLGALTLGGFNVLVLDDLSVVLPERHERDSFSTSDKRGTAKDLAAVFGVDNDLLNANGWRPRFSGLRISNLDVAALDAATNVIPCFVAARGEAKRNGLHLSGCGIISGTLTNWVGEAVLSVKPTLRLTWSSGSMEL